MLLVSAVLAGVAVMSWLWPGAAPTVVGATAPLPAREWSVPPSTGLAAGVAAGAGGRGGPDRVVIPSLGVDAPAGQTVSVSRETWELFPPDDAARLGVWDGGRGLGSADTGATVVVGHVSTLDTPRGALYGLSEILPGAVVLTYDGLGAEQAWVVTELFTTARAASHTDLFTVDGPRRLALVTCGGAVDADGFPRNVIVVAVPAVE
ncbi:MAG: class F sortase [Propionibacteriaceae bacterium]|jgi:hypothetical protein|nr:class F sortase [Propionibacteriaceae bacterium]